MDCLILKPGEPQMTPSRTAIIVLLLGSFLYVFFPHQPNKPKSAQVTRHEFTHFTTITGEKVFGRLIRTDTICLKEPRPDCEDMRSMQEVLLANGDISLFIEGSPPKAKGHLINQITPTLAEK